MNTNRLHDLWVKICFGTAVFCLCGLILAGQGRAADKTDVVQFFDHGHINWSTGLLISSGVAAPPAKKEAKTPQAFEEALAQAKVLALQHMRDIVLKTRIDSPELVGSIVAANDIMMAKVESLLKSAKAVRQEYLSDGTVEVFMQMPMYGGFSQLVLPEEIKQIEPIKTVSNGNGNSENVLQESRTDIEEETYTGIVVDARGIQFSPAMAPVIVDEKSREVYGSAFVSREFAVQQGMTGYSRDVQTAGQNPRVSGNPLMVKGLGTVENSPSTIIISNADASKIKSASEHISFLKKCRVMIVAD
jgi:hypothetical protein